MIGSPCLRYAQLGGGLPYVACHVTASKIRNFAEYHTHDFNEVLFVQGGSCTHNINGSEQLLEEGDLIFIRSKDTHSFSNPTPDLDMIQISFPTTAWRSFTQGAALHKIVSTIEDPRDPLSLVLDDDEYDVTQWIAEDLVARGTQGGDALELHEFFCFVARMYRILDSTNDGPEWLSDAIKEMEDDENLMKGLDYFVEACGVTLPHLCRVTRRHLNQSPTELLNEIRMQRVREFLAGTDLPLQDIAERVGIHSLSYLHRLFRTAYGESPETYRRTAGVDFLGNSSKQ